jgi:hypothetical protein
MELTAGERDEGLLKIIAAISIKVAISILSSGGELPRRRIAR